VRLFQNSGMYPTYLPRLRRLTEGITSFESQVKAFLADRFGAPHFLKPVLDHDASAFFTNGDDPLLQHQWAREQGLPRRATLTQILLAQIEQHRTEVFYNLDPMRFQSEFVRKLPGCVKRAIAWRAAPSPGADLGAYHRVVCNFPSILESYRKAGWNAAYFVPAHDPVMDRYAANADRPIDVLFVGGYSRHHRRRAELLEAIAGLASVHAVAMHLDRSRVTRLAESEFGRLLPLAAHRRPPNIRRASREPIFGLDLYEALSLAKIVVNGAIDMAGDDRGNMRCFEAMGCGALLLTDEGNYPEGMTSPETMVTYNTPAAALTHLARLLDEPGHTGQIAKAGHEMVRVRYSKDRQWARFAELAT